MTTGAAVSGTRAWLATREFKWLTPTRLRRATISLIVAGLLASGLFVSGSGAPGSAAAHASAAPAASR